MQILTAQSIIAIAFFCIGYGVCHIAFRQIDEEREKYVRYLETYRGLELYDAKIKIYYNGKPFDEFADVKEISERGKAGLIRIEYGEGKVFYADKEFVSEIKIMM